MESNISEKQIKGIDLSVRATKKVFPFITGWEFTPDWEKYSTVIYINLIIDFVTLGKTIDMEVKDYYIKNFTSGEEYKTAVILSPFDWGVYGSEKWEDMVNASTSLSQKIRLSLRKAYEFIPDEMSVFNEYGSGVLSSKHKPNLTVDDFIQKVNPLATI